jgi:16S rRNA (guanine527-N7)-methyltransferase
LFRFPEGVFHVKHEGWTVGDLSAGQLKVIDDYEDLLRDVAIPRGMVAAADRQQLRDRHILDSLRAVPHLDTDPGPVVDLGSGAGLPGIPVAIARPDLALTLAEPRQARAAFLELVIERLGLADVQVFAGPAEDLGVAYGVCLARGFGDISRTWAIAEMTLRPTGELIYWAGRTFRAGDMPQGARIRETGRAALESGGPIVIMTRQ